MLKKFCSYYKPHLKLFIFDLCCAFMVAAINLIYPMLTRTIVNEYVPNKMLQALLISAGVLLVIYIIKCILNFIIQYWGHIVGVRIQGDMRKDLFSHLESLPFSYFDENKTGTIMSRIINDLQDIAELAHHGPEDIFLSLITLIGSGIIMAININPWLTLIVFSIIPFVVMYAIMRRKRMRDAFKQMREETGKINAQVESSVSGIRVSKAYTAKEHEVNAFEKHNEDFKKARGRAYKEMGLFGSGMQFFMDFLYLVALVSGGLFFYFEKINGGDFTAYILYVTSIISPIRTLVAIYEQIQNGMTGFSRFIEVIETPAEAEDSEAIELIDFNSNIVFDNVSFKYDVNSFDHHPIDPNKLVINKLSFEIKKGSTTALVGPSGGGKTTICHLIPRFYEVLDGSILIDGTDIRKYTRHSLRKQIGIVAQDVFLFGGTIKDNIAYGNFEASDEEIEEACKKANIHEFIMSLELGYDTYVGERGVKLSGGQKQRIAIARAFLKNPPILILDEATSALDNITEMQIQSALEELSVGRTTIVVAHRLSTVKNADDIMVINNEGIIERGNHQESIEKNGVYANLYQYQFKE